MEDFCAAVDDNKQKKRSACEDEPVLLAQFEELKRQYYALAASYIELANQL